MPANVFVIDWATVVRLARDQRSSYYRYSEPNPENSIPQEIRVGLFFSDINQKLATLRDILTGLGEVDRQDIVTLFFDELSESGLNVLQRGDVLIVETDDPNLFAVGFWDNGQWVKPETVQGWGRREIAIPDRFKIPIEFPFDHWVLNDPRLESLRRIDRLWLTGLPPITKDNIYRAEGRGDKFYLMYPFVAHQRVLYIGRRLPIDNGQSSEYRAVEFARFLETARSGDTYAPGRWVEPTSLVGGIEVSDARVLE